MRHHLRQCRAHAEEHAFQVHRDVAIGNVANARRSIGDRQCAIGDGDPARAASAAS